MKNLLLVTPPFTQLNTPYPATAYLKGFLNTKSISSYQMDLGIEVILKIFSKKGLTDIFSFSEKEINNKSENSRRIFKLQNDYVSCIEDVILFLQGGNETLARLICAGNFLPQAGRFNNEQDLDFAFGIMGMQDKAKYLSTLFLEDLSDFIVECIDPLFGFSRYAEKLGRSANSFDELHGTLSGDATYIDNISLSLLNEKLIEHKPELVCFSVPFPGNLYSAFKCAAFVKTHFPNIKTAMGGGFANTELRSVSDTRVFDFFDFITLDDGETPIELLNNVVLKNLPYEEQNFKRTFLRLNNEVKYLNASLQKDYKQAEVGTPDYTDLPLSKYISVIEVANPMHSLWSDGRWNKLTMAHGCYWGKCTFCDISLDYIKVYEPIAAKTLVDRIEALIEQTGERGFHFVDEAAPPSLMKEVALEILKRGINISWWTNIRFEKSFTVDLCQLLAASGCIAVSGGLEVASDRLLALIDKGVTVEQVTQVTRNFTVTGIMVHAYLMYGYPTQTIQETVDSLEMVRQLFEAGVMQSGFWHQFALTAHSPVGLQPDVYGIIPKLKEISFANNDIDFEDTTGIDHSKFSFGLKKSLYNYMHKQCFEFELQEWFDFEIPETSVQPDLILRYLENNAVAKIKPSSRIIWLGKSPELLSNIKLQKKGQVKLLFDDKTEPFEIILDIQHSDWWINKIEKARVKSSETLTYSKLKADFEDKFIDFEKFWNSNAIQKMRDYGLLIL